MGRDEFAFLLQIEFGKAGVMVGAVAQGPEILAVRVFDREVVDAGGNSSGRTCSLCDIDGKPESPSRVVPITTSPLARTALASSRPNPREIPLTNQIF
jgi:hypothetical protein